MGDHRSCQCETCRASCERKPGTFMPGEAEVLAANMGISFEQLFADYLVVDAEYSPTELFQLVGVLRPAAVNDTPGTVSLGHGACVFFRGGKCGVHMLGKPYECRAAFHSYSPNAERADFYARWLPHQPTLATLTHDVAHPDRIVRAAFDDLFREPKEPA